VVVFLPHKGRISGSQGLPQLNHSSQISKVRVLSASSPDVVRRSKIDSIPEGLRCIQGTHNDVHETRLCACVRRHKGIHRIEPSMTDTTHIARRHETRERKSIPVEARTLPQQQHQNKKIIHRSKRVRRHNPTSASTRTDQHERDG